MSAAKPPSRYQVWAPNASSVVVHVNDGTNAASAGGTRYPMTNVGGGWWRSQIEARPGTDYGFSLDGGEPLPDPRSAWQPHGVHGLSRVVDHDGFDWQATDWPGRNLLGRVVYEMHVGTFTTEGTFEAATTRLDHLVSMGIEFVEILPVAAFPGHHGWGYDGVFLYAVHDAYGGPDGLRRFVDACHRRGLGAILDVVYNHLGPDGDVLPRFGPYFDSSIHTPWGAAINYGGDDSLEVRRFVIDNALMWLRDYRFDALRLDAVHAIVDDSPVHVLEELATEVTALSAEIGRPLALVAESDLNDPQVISARAHGGYGIDAQWSDDFHHALHAVLTGERSGYYEDFGSMRDLATTYTQGFLYTGQESAHRGRRHGKPLPPSVSAHQLVGYAQDHDQIGNRADGARLASLVSPGLAKVAAGLVLASPFTPMLFMGEEWGASTPWQYFTDHTDPELAEAVRTGRRNEFKAFGWRPDEVPDPQDPATFRRSTLDWSELAADQHADLLQWHRDLLALRKRRPDLASGAFDQVRVEVDEEQRWLTLLRGRTLVVANLSQRPQLIGWPAAVPSDAVRLLLASAEVVLDRGANGADGGVTVPGESIAFFALADPAAEDPAAEDPAAEDPAAEGL